MSEQLNFKQVPFDTMYYNNLTKQGGQVLIECDPNRTVLKIIESCITKNNTVLSNAELAQWILRYYIARTKNHVGMVQVCAAYLKEFFTFGGYFERFMAKIQQHDYDKFSGNEHVASYAMNAPLYKYPNLYDISPEAKRIYEEIEWPKHHQLHDHHPEHYMRRVSEDPEMWAITDEEMEEFFKDKGGHPAALMALGEMVADWMAVGVEMGNTAKSWWLKNKDTHWSYGPRYTQALEACLAFAPEQLFIDQIEPIPDPPKLRTVYSSESSHVVIRKESDINSIADLKVFFSRCKYGLVDKSTGKLWRDTHKNTTKEDYENHWRLLSPDETVKYRCGICYDTVLVSKSVFDRLGIKYEMYFSYCNKGDGPTHTFIIYQDGNVWKWMEGSWGAFKNNNLSNPSSSELVANIGKELANASGIQQQILVLSSYPRPGVTMSEFQNVVLKGSKWKVVDPDENYLRSNEVFTTSISTEGWFDPVKEEGMHYTIHNFPVLSFFHKLRKEYKTSKLEHLFDVIGVRLFSANKRTIVIHKFFVPELLYLLDKYNFPNSLITTIRSNTWVGAVRPITGAVDLNYINQTMQVSLYDHQTEFLKNYLPNKIKNHLRGYLLSFEQGLGKTITSICLMEGLKKERIVIICPKNTMVETWNAHLDKFFKNTQKVWVAGYTKGPLYASARWIIVNYERIDEVKEFLIKNQTNSLGIIVDESHNFLRTSSQRTQQLIDLTNNNRNADILMMSGTPIKLCGVEMIPLLRVLDPYCDDEAVAIFKRTFGFNTSIANDVLNARLSRMMTRVRKDILNLPEKKESVVNVKMSTGWKYTASQVEKQIVEFIRERQDYYNQHLQQYIDAFEEAITWLKRDPVVGRQPDFQRYLNIIDWLRESHISDARGNADIVWANQYERDVLIPALPEDLRKKFIWSKSVVKYLPLKIKGEVIGTLLTRLRMQMTTEMLQAADIKQYVDNAVKKTVIFTSYVDTIEVAYNYFKSQGYNVAAVYGKTASELTDTIQRFQEDQSVNPLIASLKMLSTGATLTAANTVIFLNKPWRSIEYQQASDRVHRIGQDTECEIISLVLDTGKEANLSTRMEDIMQWSSDQFDQIVDQKERELMRKFFKSFASLEIPEDCVVSLEKYDPPYNEEQMREHGYSEEIIERLKNDPVHGWRMETGIELIHREPTRTELKRIWKNWQQMTPDQKRISDRKCRELFGCDNKTLYEYLLPQYKVESPDKGVVKYPPKSDGSSLEAISADTKTKIKKITFPSEEIDTLKKQNRIVTTRVSADYNKFFVDDLVQTPWGDIFKVTKREEISDVKDHPYFNELTEGQKKFLSKYSKIAVLTLMKTMVQDALSFSTESMALLTSTPEERRLTNLAKPLYVPIGKNSWEHIQQDVGNAIDIIRTLQGRGLTLKEYAAILFHDCSVKARKSKDRHSYYSAEMARRILSKTTYFTSEDIDEICQAIEEHDEFINPNGIHSSDLSDLLASADCNPPNVAWILNKSYSHGMENGLTHEERIQNAVRYIPKKYGTHGTIVYPKMYAAFNKKAIIKMQQTFDTLTPEECERIIMDYRRRHGLKEGDLSLPDPSLESISSDSGLKLYHLSYGQPVASKTLTPRVPDNEFVEWGVEDGKTKRVCFSTSISKATLAMGRCKEGQELHVYEVDLSSVGQATLMKHIVTPSKDQVPDVDITKEVWCTIPVKVKYTKTIKLTSIKHEYTLKFKRKDGTEYVGHPREWNYDVVSTVDPRPEFQPSTEQLGSSMEATTTPSKIAQKKKKILDFICKLCDTMEPSGLNSKRYRQIIGQMNDKEFDQFMNYMKEGKWQLHIVAPNMIVNLQNEDLLKACDLIGLDLFQRVWMYDKATGRKFLTDNKYMFVKLPIRRQQQFLDEKISVPDNDRTIDGLTGQVTGDSRSCSITNPEIQILAARGLNNTLQELVNIRGGNIHGYSEFRRMLEENGEGDLDMLDTGSRTRASVVGGKLLQSMMLDTNL